MPGCSVTASVSGPAGQAYGWSAYPCTGAVSSTTTATAADRKSTRLNSSHSQISYAVFCLKKKKIAREECEIVGYRPRQVSRFITYTYCLVRVAHVLHDFVCPRLDLSPPAVPSDAFDNAA